MDKPRVFADFHNADIHGRLRLNCIGTVEDLAHQQIVLRDGLLLMLYSEDLEVDGLVRYSTDEHLWVAIIDWNAIRRVASESPLPEDHAREQGKMDQVGETWLKGNYGEHLVTQILSRSCRVRPVVGHTDVGVDLYCESIIDGRPFLHFWGQVKSSQSFPNEPVRVSHSFEVSALQYWANQPVPVLGFLVPMKWPPEEIHYIHVVDITFDILEHGIVKGQKTQILSSKPELILPISNIYELNLKLRSLLLDHIPMIVSTMHAEKGFVFLATKPQDEYIKYFAAHFLSRYMPQIELRMRHAVTFGIIQYIDAGNSLDTVPKYYFQP